MQRQISAPKETEIKAPTASKSEIRQFAAAIDYMVDQMAKRYRHQVLEALQKSTVEKFQTTDAARADSAIVGGVAFKDAQVGNFARVFLTMSDKVRRKLLKQFDDDRLEQLAKKYTEKANKRNADLFYSAVESKVGISKAELEATEGLTAQINAYKLETFQWIRKMRDDTMAEWTGNTLRDMAEGKSLPEIMQQFDGMVEKRRNHAKMIARTQISTFNSLTSKARARNLGIEKAVWVTAHDERVRPSHKARDGKEFDLAEGLYSSIDGKTLLPGTDYQCRCDYRMIIPSMEQ
jgi:SPP1 gp7 family putative phage head morphogenesis protein